MSNPRSTLGHVVAANALFVAVLCVSSSAAAQCDHLNLSVTDHSCFHARLGPFAEVTAAYDGGPSAVDNVDEVHTHYRVALPVSSSTSATHASVTYTPVRAGHWAIFMEYRLPLEVMGPDGRAVPTDLVDDVADCPFFEHVQSHVLMAGETYEFRFGLTDASSSVVVIEKVDDFLEQQGLDEDGDGYGAAADAVASACRPRAGYVDNDRDCDDTDATIHPGAPEICDDVDRNCNGSPDDVGAPCSAGRGACAVTGVASCEQQGQPPTCGAVAMSPGVEQCNGEDDDCDGTVDNGLDTLCGSADVPRCVADGTGTSFCGCESDSDCGGPESGRLCLREGAIQRCATGCVDGFGRNGCLPSEFCTSQDPTVPGQCVPAPDSDMEAPVDAGSMEPPADSGGGGCQCQVGARTPVRPRILGWLLAMVVLGGYVVRRRNASERTGR